MMSLNDNKEDKILFISMRNDRKASFGGIDMVEKKKCDRNFARMEKETDQKKYEELHKSAIANISSSEIIGTDSSSESNSKRDFQHDIPSTSGKMRP